MNLSVYCQDLKNGWFQNTESDLEVNYGIVDSKSVNESGLYNYLSDDEKARAKKFKNISDYNCYVCVHALLRIELSKRMNSEPKLIPIEQPLNGKPFITGVDLPFSISRTKNYFAFVIGMGNQFLGIDIEQIKPHLDFKSVARNFFSRLEQESIFLFDKIDDQRQIFFEIWTRKEALLKAIGIGLNTELNKVQVLEGENLIEIKDLKTSPAILKISTITTCSLIISIASSIDFVPSFKELSLSQIVFP